MTDTTLPTASPTAVTPGWKTSEFWLTTATKALGILLASGVVGTGSTLERVCGLAATVLAMLGYTVSRTLVKTAGAMVLLVGFAAMQPSCATGRTVAAIGVDAFIDCQEPNLKTTADEAYKLAETAVLSTISGDGKHVDSAALKSALGGIKSDGLRCAVAAAVAALATPAKPVAGAPMAAGLEVDGPALKAAYAQVTAGLGWGTYKAAL